MNKNYNSVDFKKSPLGDLGVFTLSEALTKLPPALSFENMSSPISGYRIERWTGL
jgi:hypothetical protein